MDEHRGQSRRCYSDSTTPKTAKLLAVEAKLVLEGKRAGPKPEPEAHRTKSIEESAKEFADDEDQEIERALEAKAKETKKKNTSK